MKVKVVNKSKYPLPQYATAGSAGMDLRANIDHTIILHPMQRIPVPTGLYMELPVGIELQIRPRSGLALNHGVTVCNAPGTIDSDFRGEIGVILINLGSEPFIINPGDRIAQGVFAKYEQGELVEVKEVSKTDRGDGKFGHTGIQ